MCLVSQFELVSRLGLIQYAFLGACKRLLASETMGISICVSKCMCVCIGLCEYPCAHVFCLCEWAHAGALAGHICDHRLLLTVMFDACPPSRPVSGFHLIRL